MDSFQSLIMTLEKETRYILWTKIQAHPYIRNGNKILSPEMKAIQRESMIVIDSLIAQLEDVRSQIISEAEQKFKLDTHKPN